MGLRLGSRILVSSGVALASYVAGAFAGGFLITVLSSNMHDRSVEAAMTGAFVCGPAAALAGFVMAMVWSGRRGSGAR